MKACCSGPCFQRVYSYIYTYVRISVLANSFEIEYNEQSSERWLFSISESLASKYQKLVEKRRNPFVKPESNSFVSLIAFENII